MKTRITSPTQQSACRGGATRWHGACSRGGMSLELIPERRLALELRPSAALVAYAQLLAVSSGEVERLVERELSRNPALERAEASRSRACPAGCPRRLRASRPTSPACSARLARDARASLPRADHPALDFLLGSIDDRGFLTVEPEVIARAVGAPLERVRGSTRSCASSDRSASPAATCGTASTPSSTRSQPTRSSSRSPGGSWPPRSTIWPPAATGRSPGAWASTARASSPCATSSAPACGRFPSSTHRCAVARSRRARPTSSSRSIPTTRTGLRVELTEERRFALRVSPAYDGVRARATR